MLWLGRSQRAGFPRCPGSGLRKTARMPLNPSRLEAGSAHQAPREPGSGARRAMGSSHQMTAEPSSRTRLYAARQASLSILVAMAAGPQGGHAARRTERNPGRPQGSERGGDARRAGGRGGGESHAGCGLRAPSAAAAQRAPRARAGTQAAPPRPPRPLAARAAARPAPHSPLAAGPRGRGVSTRRRPIPARAGCATPRWGLEKGLFPPPPPSFLSPLLSSPSSSSSSQPPPRSSAPPAPPFHFLLPNPCHLSLSSVPSPSSLFPPPQALFFPLLTPPFPLPSILLLPLLASPSSSSLLRPHSPPPRPPMPPRCPAAELHSPTGDLQVGDSVRQTKGGCPHAVFRSRFPGEADLERRSPFPIGEERSGLLPKRWGITVYFVFWLFAFRSHLPLWVPLRARADSFCLPHSLSDSLIHSLVPAGHKDQLQCGGG